MMQSSRFVLRRRRVVGRVPRTRRLLMIQTWDCSPSNPNPPPGSLQRGTIMKAPQKGNRKGRQYSFFKILFAGAIIFIHYITDQEKVQFSPRIRASGENFKLNNIMKINIYQTRRISIRDCKRQKSIFFLPYYSTKRYCK